MNAPPLRAVAVDRGRGAGIVDVGRPILRAVVFVGLAAVVLLGALGRRRAGDRASRP